jgi:hypothetical protein
MKRIHITFFLVIFTFGLYAQIDLSKKIPGIKYESSYTFSKAIDMEMAFFNKKGKLRMAIPYWALYNPGFKHFNIKHKRGSTVYQTIFDMPNNNCLIVLGEGDQVTGSASVMKDNEGRELKTLPLTKTDETRSILGKKCTKYTFDVERFSGEMWVTTQVNLPNKVGVLKASQMNQFYEDVPVEGFVLEITSINKRGMKTVMRTTALPHDIDVTVTIPEEFGRAINKVDYYDM